MMMLATALTWLDGRRHHGTSGGSQGDSTLAMVVIDRWAVSTVAAGGVKVTGTMTVAPMGGFGSAVVAGPATVTVTGEIASSTALDGSAEGTGTMTASAAEEISPLAGVGSIAGIQSVVI